MDKFLARDPVEARRREIARRLLQFQEERRETSGYEFQQAQHWFYCLSETIGNDRRDHEDFWAWVKRASD